METVNHECYVDLEVAKLLKEAGFKWGCRAAWDLTFPNEPYLNHAAVYPTDFNNDVDDILYAPTLDVAQRWLREVKGYYVQPIFYINCSLTNSHRFWSKYFREPLHTHEYFAENFSSYDTYESALEAGIKECLELILEKRESEKLYYIS